MPQYCKCYLGYKVLWTESSICKERHLGWREMWQGREAAWILVSKIQLLQDKPMVASLWDWVGKHFSWRKVIAWCVKTTVLKDLGSRQIDGAIIHDNKLLSIDQAALASMAYLLYWQYFWMCKYFCIFQSHCNVHVMDYYVTFVALFVVHSIRPETSLAQKRFW